MKKEYTTPIIEIEEIKLSDIILESGTGSEKGLFGLTPDATTDW